MLFGTEDNRVVWKIPLDNARKKLSTLLNQADKKTFKVYHFQDNSLNTFGVIEIRTRPPLVADVIYEELQVQLIKFIQDLGTTNCVFYLQIWEKRYKGWIVWHGVEYKLNIIERSCRTTTLSHTSEHSIRQLFLFIDRARILEGLGKIYHRYKKGLEVSINK